MVPRIAQSSVLRLVVRRLNRIRGVLVRMAVMRMLIVMMVFMMVMDRTMKMNVRNRIVLLPALGTHARMRMRHRCQRIGDDSHDQEQRNTTI
jgi:hypothetical protein